MAQTKSTKPKNKSVAEKSSIENGDQEVKDAGVQSQEDLIAQIVGRTMERMAPYFGGNTTKEQQKESVKNVKERLVREMNEEYERIIKENRQFMEKLARSPKSDYRKVAIPKVFRKYFGSQLVVGLNGSFVTVPVDGRPHRVHKDFYSIIMSKLDYIDDKVDSMERTDFTDVMEVDDRESLGQ